MGRPRAVEARHGIHSSERGGERGQQVRIGIAGSQVDEALGDRALIEGQRRAGRVEAYTSPPAPLTDDDAAGLEATVGCRNGDGADPGRGGELADRRQELTWPQGAGMHGLLDRPGQVASRSAAETTRHINIYFVLLQITCPAASPASAVGGLPPGRAAQAEGQSGLCQALSPNTASGWTPAVLKNGAGAGPTPFSPTLDWRYSGWPCCWP